MPCPVLQAKPHVYKYFVKQLNLILCNPVRFEVCQGVARCGFLSVDVFYYGYWPGVSCNGGSGGDFVLAYC